MFGNQLDYLGIVILMWGSTIPSIYYGFYCDPTLQKAYWINVSFDTRSFPRHALPRHPARHAQSL